MKMVCTFKCQFRGDTVKVGEIRDLTAEEAKSHLAASFAKIGDDEPKADAAEVVVAGLTRDQAIAKLNELKVKIPSKISNEKLKERYLEVVGDGK
jgi:hypothetical protein